MLGVRYVKHVLAVPDSRSV